MDPIIIEQPCSKNAYLSHIIFPFQALQKNKIQIQFDLGDN